MDHFQLHDERNPALPENTTDFDSFETENYKTKFPLRCEFKTLGLRTDSSKSATEHCVVQTWHDFCFRQHQLTSCAFQKTYGEVHTGSDVRAKRSQRHRSDHSSPLYAEFTAWSFPSTSPARLQNTRWHTNKFNFTLNML